MSRAAERPAVAALALDDLRRERDHARAEYLAATRTIPREGPLAERGRRWRAFTEANAAYLRAKGDAQ